MEYIFGETMICMCCGKKIRFWQTYHELGLYYSHCRCWQKKDRDYMIGKRVLDSQSIKSTNNEVKDGNS